MNNVVHVAPTQSVELYDIIGLLSLATVKNSPTCSNWKDYNGLCEIANTSAVNRVIVEAANGDSPIFTIDN